MIDVTYEIEKLLKFALKKKLICELDIIPCRNELLDILKIESPYIGEVEDFNYDTPVSILENILDYAFEAGIIESNTTVQRDLLDSKIMGVLLPRQSEVNRVFYEKMKSGGVEEATNYFYALCRNSNYIRTERIAKNQKWITNTEYGDLEITINLSKPEKDPKDIAKAKTVKESSYPKCLLCIENVGYAGKINHPARQNLRAIELKLAGEKWYFQYSPYLYYNEHCIVLNSKHCPMKCDIKTFQRLLDFVDLFPHYFIGSNADLPIVGGSILTHDHYQGGKHEFPMEKAAIEKKFVNHEFKNVDISIVKWPMSVIRISSAHKEALVKTAMHIFNGWKNYNDAENNIQSCTGNVMHNTVTPIARKKHGIFEMDIVLRNNRTSDEYPDGIFHPHKELHHIKKENIGLIEVMGLAVLPGRLKRELKKVANVLLQKDKYDRKLVMADSDLSKHMPWIEKIIEENTGKLTEEEIEVILKNEVGIIFSKVLEDAGVFKRNADGQKGFEKFLSSININ